MPGLRAAAVKSHAHRALDDSRTHHRPLAAGRAVGAAQAA
jgi:hypothetical protein